MKLFQRTSQLNENWNRAKQNDINFNANTRLLHARSLWSFGKWMRITWDFFSTRLGKCCPFGHRVYVMRMGVSWPAVRDRSSELDGICINTEYQEIGENCFAACVFVCRTRLVHIPKTGHGKGRIFSLSLYTYDICIAIMESHFKLKVEENFHSKRLNFRFSHAPFIRPHIIHQLAGHYYFMHTRKTWFVQIHEWHQSKSVSPANTTAGIYSEFVFHVWTQRRGHWRRRRRRLRCPYTSGKWFNVCARRKWGQQHNGKAHWIRATIFFRSFIYLQWIMRPLQHDLCDWEYEWAHVIRWNQ